MLKRFFFFLLLTLPLFVTAPALAANNCKIANWEPNRRDLQVCVGGFTSKEQLRQSTANFNCLGNSNSPQFSLCSGIQARSISLADTPDNQIAQDTNGHFYTCLVGQGLNRAIGKINVLFTDKNGQNICTSDSIVTRPADWDIATEGLPWQQGTNNPLKSGSPICPDGISINTAFGCISTDPTSFISNLLSLAVGSGGTVGLLLLLYGFFILATSSGVPEKIQAAKDIISSAIIGLVLVILAVVLTRFIGISLFALPGLQ